MKPRLDRPFTSRQLGAPLSTEGSQPPKRTEQRRTPTGGDLRSGAQTSSLAPRAGGWLRNIKRVGAGAAAALLATAFGGQANAQVPTRTTQTTQIGANLPRQVGANLTVKAYAVGADDARLHAMLARIETRLHALAVTEPKRFEGMLGQVFGARMHGEAGEALLRTLRSGEGILPDVVRLLPSEQLNGAEAAYDAEHGQILVSTALLGDEARLERVLLEELGHHFDARLGPGDAVGDEGHLFRLAVERGRPLTQPELQSGRLDRDHGVIQIGAHAVKVEFSVRAEDRAYEVGGSFSAADVARGVEARLAAMVDDELIARAAAEDPTVGTLEAAEAHFGDGLEAARADAKKAIVGDDAAAFEKTLGDALIKEAVTSSVVVRLVEGGVLPEQTRLETKLPPSTQRRVNEDEHLSRLDPKVQTWGQLAQALAGDVDADGRLDFDAFGLQRFLPDASAQDILRAVQKPLTASQMREKLHAVGFDSPMLEGFSITAALELVPPKLFGLEGRTKIDKTQQQLLLRTGKLFVDSNQNDRIDDGDAVHFVDRDGTVKQTTYGELPGDLKKLVRLNMATAQVAEQYAGLPAYQRMRFPHYDSNTGKPGEERVNSEFWTISQADANRGQTSWELKADRPVRTLEDVKDYLASKNQEFAKVREAKVAALTVDGVAPSAHDVEIALIKDYRGETVKGHRPSEALDDVFVGNGGQYTTECAHGRTLIRLQGLRHYYTQSFGEGLGRFRFDLLFAASQADKQKGQDYAAAFEAHQAEHPDATWEDYTKDNPPPEIGYAMEVSRHRVFGKDEAVVEPFGRQQMGAAAGDTGYFHNYSVSVEGVKIGYVGENVIDLGYQDGVRRYWGHPGGIQDEKSWQGELASRRIKVHGMKEFAQYFSHVDVKRGSARVTRMRIEEADKKIRDLRVEQPAGYQDQIAQLEGTKGWWTALDVTRQSLVDHLDRDRLDEAEELFAGAVPLRDPDDAGAIFDLLTADGHAKIAAAFEALPEENRAQAITHFGVGGAAELDAGQKAKAVIAATYQQYGRMHSYLKEEAASIVTTERFMAKQGWLTGDGKMADKANFSAWLKTDEFRAWFEENAGHPWAGGDDLSKMSLDDVRSIVELAFPMVKGKRTVYAEVNRGSQLLSNQMATLLKEGKLPDAEYRVDAMAVAPLE